MPKLDFHFFFRAQLFAQAQAHNCEISCYRRSFLFTFILALGKVQDDRSNAQILQSIQAKIDEAEGVGIHRFVINCAQFF